MSLTHRIYLAAIATSFLPFSFATGFGYVSPVDALLGVLFLFALAKTLKDGCLPSADFSIVVASLAVFALIFIIQYRSGAIGDVNIIVKYFLFLVIIPLVVNVFRMDANSGQLKNAVPKIVSYSGASLACAVLIQYLRGQYVADSGSYYIVFFGQYAHKNGLASILIYGVLASIWCYVDQKKKIFAILGLMQFLVIVFIGARSATLVGIVLAPMLFMFSKGLSVSKIIRNIFIIIIAATLVYGVLLSGLFGDQLARFSELSDTNTDDVTASTSRILLWQFAIDKISGSLWFGNGFGTFSYVGEGWLDGMYEPHNNILQITYAGGAVVLMMFMFMIGRGLKRLWISKIGRVYFFILLSYLVNTMVGIIWTRGDGHLFWLLFFGSILFLKSKHRSNILNIGDNTIAAK